MYLARECFVVVVVVVVFTDSVCLFWNTPRASKPVIELMADSIKLIHSCKSHEAQVQGTDG